MTVADLYEVLRGVLEADFGCRAGEVDMAHGPICASPVHAAALYTVHGCQFARNVAGNVADALQAEPRYRPGGEA